MVSSSEMRIESVGYGRTEIDWKADSLALLGRILSRVPNGCHFSWAFDCRPECWADDRVGEVSWRVGLVKEISAPGGSRRLA